MLNHRGLICVLAGLSLAWIGTSAAGALEAADTERAVAQGQGRGQGPGQGQGKARGQQGGEQGRGNGQGARVERAPARGPAQDRARGRSEDRPGASAPGRARGSVEAVERNADAGRGLARGRAAHRERARQRVRDLPEGVRRMASSARRDERMVLGAVAFGSLLGLDADRLRVRSEPGRVLVYNYDDDLLFALDEGRARDLGQWRLRRVTERPGAGNGPAFCRSGEGHPVWGREWCLDKGFGLGGRSGRMWARGDVDDVIFRRSDRVALDRLDDWDDLLGVLGEVVVGRLALHALSLGYAEPLNGVWIAEPEAPRILRVRAGDDVVAELVDLDRDDRVEVLYVQTLD